jgi:hypothetical protein
MVEEQNPETFISVLIVFERFSQNRDVSHVKVVKVVKAVKIWSR